MQITMYLFFSNEIICHEQIYFHVQVFCKWGRKASQSWTVFAFEVAAESVKCVRKFHLPLVSDKYLLDMRT
jgi:hypothetical protein